jgi:outer membrane receptor for ferrienterochelin and colicins
MKKYILLLFVIALSKTLFSQPGHENELTIKGKVITIENGVEMPVPNAKLLWSEDEHMALSELDGTFEIHVLKLPDTLFVKMTGFKLASFAVNDPTINYTINLQSGQMLNGVEVIALSLGKSIDLMDPTNIETIGQDELRKAACCNLSESFETNASVDVNMTDAISGAKKIQMLGLDGIYTQIQYENIPMVRGLSSSFGLNYTPGTWVESIQITKGTGSVVNGYESMAGLINIEFKQPEHGESFYFNFYGNKFGRAEFNVHSAYRLNDKWGTMTFAHFSNYFAETDVNKDGFRDFPIGHVGAFMHRWNYVGKNYETKFGIKANYGDQLGGQMGYDPSSEPTCLISRFLKMNT